MVVFYVVFGLLLNRGGDNYIAFLLAGLTPWNWFSKAVSSTSSSIIGGQQLMMQIGIPAIFFPMVCILQSTLKQIPVFLLLFAVLGFLGFLPTFHWIALVPVLAVQLLLVILVSCVVAALIPFFRDLAYLVNTGLTFTMFLSGVFYDFEKIPPEWQATFLLNPVAFLLNCYRTILLDGAYPDIEHLGILGAICGAGCLAILILYSRLRYIFPRVLSE